MSKFRARQLDATKPIAIYLQEDITDYADISNNASNRTVPQMPTGMEKEEETEHHLQQAIFHHRVIPVPEVFAVCQVQLDKQYPPNYKNPRQLIHIHPFSAEQDIPDYDLDSEDEQWLAKHSAKGDLLPLTNSQFEEMMDRLEKSSGLKAATLQEAKLLLNEDDDLITAVYDYWLNKRLSLQHALIPQVKSEKGVGSAPSDPYVAFRKRTEKMQTRKNRKNDESSYEKMLKLRRDLGRSADMLSMVKKREKMKRELLHLDIEVFEKRYELEDWSGVMINEILTKRAQMRAAFAPLVSNHLNAGVSNTSSNYLKLPFHNQQSTQHRNKSKSRRERKYTKRLKQLSTSTCQQETIANYNHSDNYTDPNNFSQLPSLSEEEGVLSSEGTGHTPSEEDSQPDGQFTFVRKNNCQYHAPRDDRSLWVTSPPPSSDGSSHFSVISLPDEPFRRTSVGRRRMGRGGRLWVDRLDTLAPDDPNCSLSTRSTSLVSKLHLNCSSEEWQDILPSFEAPPSPPREIEERVPPLSPSHSFIFTAEMLDGPHQGIIGELSLDFGSQEEPHVPPSRGSLEVLHHQHELESLLNSSPIRNNNSCSPPSRKRPRHSYHPKLSAPKHSMDRSHFSEMPSSKFVLSPPASDTRTPDTNNSLAKTTAIRTLTPNLNVSSNNNSNESCSGNSIKIVTSSVRNSVSGVSNAWTSGSNAPSNADVNNKVTLSDSRSNRVTSVNTVNNASSNLITIPISSYTTIKQLANNSHINSNGDNTKSVVSSRNNSGVTHLLTNASNKMLTKNNSKNTPVTSANESFSIVLNGPTRNNAILLNKNNNLSKVSSAKPKADTILYRDHS